LAGGAPGGGAQGAPAWHQLLAGADERLSDGSSPTCNEERQPEEPHVSAPARESLRVRTARVKSEARVALNRLNELWAMAPAGAAAGGDVQPLALLDGLWEEENAGDVMMEEGGHEEEGQGQEGGAAVMPDALALVPAPHPGNQPGDFARLFPASPGILALPAADGPPPSHELAAQAGNRECLSAQAIEGYALARQAAGPDAVSEDQNSINIVENLEEKGAKFFNKACVDQASELGVDRRILRDISGLRQMCTNCVRSLAN
jgi:hypothetical protein